MKTAIKPKKITSASLYIHILDLIKIADKIVTNMPQPKREMYGYKYVHYLRDALLYFRHAYEGLEHISRITNSSEMINLLEDCELLTSMLFTTKSITERQCHNLLYPLGLIINEARNYNVYLMKNNNNNNNNNSKEDLAETE